jgi:hypothetical protein
MYDETSPASDIRELAKFLAGNHTPQNLYRGQTRFFSVNAPSGMRSGLSGVCSEGWNAIDPDYWKKASHREQAKSDLRMMLLTVFGRGVGNIICQQYGISSDAYDITSDPVVAAFFATRTYPTYEPLLPDSENDLGVIYRFTLKQPQPDLQTMEHSLNSLQLTIEGTRKRIIFSNVILLKGLILKDKLEISPDEFINSKIPGEKSSVQLTRQAAYVAPETIKLVFLEKAAQLRFEGDLVAYFESSRAFHQRGGIYFPPMRHTALVNREIQADPVDERTFFANPPTALSMGIEDVFELNSNPYVDRFFFRHRKGVEINIDGLDVLWPDRERDAIFHDICGVAEKECSRYLSDYKTSVMDPILGLIDRGYCA